MDKPISKVNGMWDTHTYYKTISHCHLSCFDGDKDYADICAVECQDGRWFLVDDQGTATTNEILDKRSEEFVEPKFFDSYAELMDFAIIEISKITGLSISEAREYVVDDE